MVGAAMIQKLALFVVIIFSLTPAFAWEWERGALNCYLNTEIGTHTKDFSGLMKLYNSLQIKGSYTYNRNISFFINIKKFYDSVYDISGQYRNGSPGIATNTGNTWLREFFMDVEHRPFFARIGRQQVVWGSSDGVRALDCINPGDSRYAYLDDAAEYRIPLWMARLEASPAPDATLQVLLIPDYEPNISAGPGDVFAFRSTKLADERLAGLPSFIRIAEKDKTPLNDFQNGSYALRWQQVIGGWEYTLNYKYGYEAYPQGAGVFALRNRRTPTLTLVKDYTKRINIFGASFTKAVTGGSLSGLTVRGEFLYTRGKPFPYGMNGQVAGNTDISAYTYILGLDKIFFTDVLTSAQLIQFIHSRTRYHGSDLFFPATFAPLHRVETMVTFRISTDFFAERLKPEMLAIYDERSDWRISPKVSYEVNNNLWLYAGLHLFYGKQHSLFGQFSDDTMIYAGQTLSF
jgi:hypothetical protein